MGIWAEKNGAWVALFSNENLLILLDFFNDTDLNSNKSLKILKEIKRGKGMYLVSVQSQTLVTCPLAWGVVPPTEGLYELCWICLICWTNIDPLCTLFIKIFMDRFKNRSSGKLTNGT